MQGRKPDPVLPHDPYWLKAVTLLYAFRACMTWCSFCLFKKFNFFFRGPKISVGIGIRYFSYQNLLGRSTVAGPSMTSFMITLSILLECKFPFPILFILLQANND